MNKAWIVIKLSYMEKQSTGEEKENQLKVDRWRPAILAGNSSRSHCDVNLALFWVEWETLYLDIAVTDSFGSISTMCTSSHYIIQLSLFLK